MALISRRFPRLIAMALVSRRFFQIGFSVGAVGVVFDLEGKILLVEYAFHPKMPWGLPGGWVNRREYPATTVRREIKEELSLDIEVGPLLLAETPSRNHLDLAYMCRTDNTVGVLITNYSIISGLNQSNCRRCRMFIAGRFNVH